ncbi:hypothetical protein M404DRAFT_166424 [Pisolithus tinctorius Marx 270]|uniref:Uncharacterized protein n=1 Tax=Pisolithus tinctorius Marx 270 TaxID=870435 RepID=A0A0C3JBY9_PISTI|nr:hypothetical protein M404DRAFT_166424 [Pisolithus tinctorius Marx 270]
MDAEIEVQSLDFRCDLDSLQLQPFTDEFPRASIYLLLAPDILHQLIKGTFKDHLVEWVTKYLEQTHGKAGLMHLLIQYVNNSIAVVPSFSGLQCFPEGWGFSQWTGDNSKALTKVYLPAIEGHVPDNIICTFQAFLEFCYLVWRDAITDETLVEIQDALT